MIRLKMWRSILGLLLGSHDLEVTVTLTIFKIPHPIIKPHYPAETECRYLLRSPRSNGYDFQGQPKVKVIAPFYLLEHV